MQAQIYWIAAVPHGRLGILGRPRAGDWLNDEIESWQLAGVTDVVSLLEDFEIRELELSQEGAVAARAGLIFERFPIPDRGIPAQPEKARRLCAVIAARIREGRSIGVHCRAGIGRSGMIAAGVLLQLGIQENMVWQRVSSARGVPVPDTDEQRHFVSKLFRDEGREP